MQNLQRLNEQVAVLERQLKNKNKIKCAGDVIFTGVDLGTADIVAVILDENKSPAAGRFRWADVLRDGLILDFVQTVEIVRELKRELESILGRELKSASGSLPPGITGRDADSVMYALQGAGFEEVRVVDQTVAAATALGISDGAVVDIGGGTTGISILKNDEIVYSADEPTGGRHMTLVIAGRYGMNFEKAEIKKRKESGFPELNGIIRPVMEKMASIIKKHIRDYDVNSIYLVGGTACTDGFDQIVEEETGVHVVKPDNPLLTTPMGVALASAAD